MITAQKIKTNGFGGYMKGFTTPIPIMTPFNILSEIATPISMACRHFGNILSGTVMMGLIYGLLPIFLKLGLPAVLHIYFDLFSGAIQTYVFCMLTMVYVTDKIGTTK